MKEFTVGNTESTYPPVSACICTALSFIGEVNGSSIQSCSRESRFNRLALSLKTEKANWRKTN